MASAPQNTSIDPDDLNRARNNWSNFIKASEYAVIGIITTLVILGALFIEW